jgi:hypothetical protein
VTCDEVRELLPEHLLGSLEGPEDLEVRRHVRGCAGCRADMVALADGVASFARASHDRTPPPELRDRVTTVLEQEWRDADEPTRPGRRSAWIGWAAAALALIVTLAWAGVQTHRANVASESAASYERLLSVLGGTEFRVGELERQGDRTIDGSVVLYDSHEGQSWAIVLVRAPGSTGTADVSLESPDGGVIEVGPIQFQPDGDGATWLVTSSDLGPFDHATITTDDGTILATAEIDPA